MNKINLDKHRLKDILRYIDELIEFASGDRENTLVQKSVVLNAILIGETANKLSKELQNREDGVPWAKIVGFRNKMVHDYEGIVLRIVWEAVDQDVPALRRQIEHILKELK